MINVVAKKKLGQNFLVDRHIINDIVCELNLDNPVIEIGSGTGALTASLISSPRLDLVELDSDLIGHLEKSYPNAKIHNADAMKFDFSSIITPQTTIVGNLPYNVGTQIILRLLEMGLKNEMIFMLQKEVADRITAGFGENGYSKLGLYVSTFAVAEKLFEVPPESFNPVPKVVSAVIRLSPHSEEMDREKFQKVLTSAFVQPRKQIGNNLKSLMTREELERLDISPTKRPAELTKSDYIKLTNALQ